MSERPIVAEFFKDSGGRLELRSMTTITDGCLSIYDVDWSRQYGYIFNQVGAGGSEPVPVHGIYFVSGDIEVQELPVQFVDARDEPPWNGERTVAIRKRNKTRRLHRLPKSLSGERDLIDWLERNGIESPSVYCSTCRDHMPDEYLCEHIWWCDQIHWYSTPDERCGCENRELCTGITGEDDG